MHIRDEIKTLHQHGLLTAVEAALYVEKPQNRPMFNAVEVANALTSLESQLAAARGENEREACANCGADATFSPPELNDEAVCSQRCLDQLLALCCPHERCNAYRNPVESAELLRLREVERAARRVLPWLPDMPPINGPRAQSEHAQAAHALRTALAALDAKEAARG